MKGLHASETVAAKVRQQRQGRGWSRRELAERSGLSEDIIEAIENGRRRNGITVDELMVLAHALSTAGAMLLPPDRDYFTDEEARQADELERQRQAEASRRRRGLTEAVEGMERLVEAFSTPGVVLAVERDGKLVSIEDEPES